MSAKAGAGVAGRKRPRPTGKHVDVEEDEEGALGAGSSSSSAALTPEEVKAKLIALLKLKGEGGLAASVAPAALRVTPQVRGSGDIGLWVCIYAHVYNNAVAAASARMSGVGRVRLLLAGSSVCTGVT